MPPLQVCHGLCNGIGSANSLEFWHRNPETWSALQPSQSPLAHAAWLERSWHDVFGFHRATSSPACAWSFCSLSVSRFFSASNGARLATIAAYLSGNTEAD